jgi:ureidoglycolate dehydrogenase (NAD+)
LRRS